MKTRTSKRTLAYGTPQEPHKVSARTFTVQAAVDDIESVLGNAHQLFDRATYLELLVRVADIVNDRTDVVHEAIAKDHHEDRDE